MQFLILPLFLLSFAVAGQDIVLNLEGLRVETKSNGYNAKESDYFDKNGNVVFTITYDADGKLDNRKNLIERRFYDQDRKLFRAEMVGPAIEKFKYDDKNNCIETMYCDEKGQPLDDGLAIVTAKYDKNGNVIEERHFDKDRQLTDGVCILKYQYDSRNRKIEESRFDRTEALIKVKGKKGLAIMRYKYDEKDGITEESFYNEDKELVEGTAIIKYNYDKKPESSSAVFDDMDPQWVEQIFLDKAGVELKRDFRYLPREK